MVTKRVTVPGTCYIRCQKVGNKQTGKKEKEGG